MYDFGIAKKRSFIKGFQRHIFLRLLLPLAVGVWCGEQYPHTLPLWSCLLAFLFLVIVFALSNRHSIRWLYGVTVYLFLFGTGFQLAGWQSAQTNFIFRDKAGTYRVRIRQEPEVKARSILCNSVLLDEYGQDTVLHNSQGNLFLLYFPKDSLASALSRGDELIINARLSPPVNNGNPDEFDYARYLKRKGITGTAYVAAGHWKAIGHDSSRTFRQVALDYREKVVTLYRSLGFRGDELAVLSALTVGDKEELSEDIVETYSVTGASHVLALSGLHIGLIYALFWFFFRFLWKQWQYLKLFLILCLILFLWGFAFLTGLSPSVVRSVIMFSLLALAGLQPEKPLTLNTLSATAFLMLLYHPAWLFDVGFQLSFSAVTAIIVFQPKFYALWAVKNRLLRYVWGLATVSIAAQLGTAPLVILYFSRFSTHFLLTNLWVIPMVTLILYSAVVLLFLTPFPFLQQAFSGVVELFVRVQNAVLHWIEELPLASADGIRMDVWEVLLFYLFMGLVYNSFKRCTAQNVYLSLCILLLIASYSTVSNLLSAPRRSIVFYNIRGCPVVHCLDEDSRSWVVSADSLFDFSRLRRTLSPYWRRLGLKQPQVITKDCSIAGLSVSNQLLCYGGKRVCLLNDARWRNKAANHPLSVDYLYISQGYEGGIEELSSLFSVGTVVFDGSLAAYHREKLINECIRLGISYLSLSEKGSVCILL